MFFSLEPNRALNTWYMPPKWWLTKWIKWHVNRSWKLDKSFTSWYGIHLVIFLKNGSVEEIQLSKLKKNLFEFLKSDNKDHSTLPSAIPIKISSSLLLPFFIPPAALSPQGPQASILPNFSSLLFCPVHFSPLLHSFIHALTHSQPINIYWTSAICLEWLHTLGTK